MTWRLCKSIHHFAVMAAVLVGMLCANGCQRPGTKAYMELLNDEKRTLEDQLYELAYNYEILEQKLKEMEHGGVGSLIEIEMPDEYHHGDGNIEVIPGGERSPTPVPDPNFAPTKDEVTDEGAAPGPSPPIIDMTPPSDLTPDAPDTLPPPTTPDLSPPALGSAGTGPTSTGIGHVHEIRLNPVQTGGEDFDDLPGDDGLTVLVEPRGPAGEVLLQPGKVSVVVVDPAAPNDRARVARWDLSEQEASERMQQDGTHRGIYLKLPWTQNRPEHSKLHLFVRYTTPDGRKLEARREFFIALNGEIANRWTPRTRQRRLARQDQPPASPRSTSPRERTPVPAPSSANSSSSASEPPADRAPVQQATRPQWSPYR